MRAHLERPETGREKTREGIGTTDMCLQHSRKRSARSRSAWVAAAVSLVCSVLVARPGPAIAFQWPWDRDGPWPSSSNEPVRELDHALLLPGEAEGRDVRFVVFGDQRALADREWPELIARIADLHAGSAVDFILDTGDIVYDGRDSDQFHFLRNLLRPVRDIPYLVAVGNHEVHNNDSPEARANTAAFLGYVDAQFDAERMYYRKDIGPATFLLLDSNDLVYGPHGERGACPDTIAPNTPEGRQMVWLSEQLALTPTERLVIVVVHHPFVQASDKHLSQARSLWNTRFGGRSILDMLADAGVDLVLTGHTHTYERYRLERSDGRTVSLVNISGRPRDAFLWYGASSRRPEDIRGEELEWFEEEGFDPLDGWSISQEEVMLSEDEANQFALFMLGPDGRLTMEVRFLDEDAPDGVRAAPVVELHSGL